MPTNCNCRMVFGDDYGDNTCTFHCELIKGHRGNHRETGVLKGNSYVVEWKRKEERK